MTCPNTPPCPHGGLFHDIYDRGDPYPMCCMPGCYCGHPGAAEVCEHEDGTFTVVRADPIIRITRELADQLALNPDQLLRLDTAGEYVYRFVRDEGGPAGIIYARTKAGAP